jgi:hypothetical protein
LESLRKYEKNKMSEQSLKSNKKGITPLMITFLLISFAVALGVVVMNLGRAQVEDVAECPINIDLQFANIGGKDDICFDGGTIKFTVENGVNTAVSGLIVNVIGAEKAETYRLPANIAKAGTYLGKVSFSGTIRQVKITPKVVLFDEEQICTEKALIIENVPDC